MRFKKTYGESKVPYCAFCGKIATLKSDSGIVVCSLHRQSQLQEIKCTCGSWLEQRSGKFGAYFNCSKCGNINFKKGMEMQGMTATSTPLAASPSSSVKETTPREIIITSRDSEYFD